MDVDSDRAILWSLKHTDFKTFPLGGKDMTECVEAIVAGGGVGGETLPAMAVRTADGEFGIMRLGDLLGLLEEPRKLHLQSKGDARRQRARVPELLRDKDDE